MINQNLKNDFVVAVQFVSIDADGKVHKSDQKLIHLEEGSLLKDAHPFFESIDNFFNKKVDHVKLDCVHMFEKSFDIEIISHKDDSGVIILRDRTDFYNRIQDIAQKRNESLIFSEVLELKNELLREKEAFKNKFIKNFSHELRSPLTLVSAFSSLLMKSEMDLEQNNLVTAIKNQSDKLRKLLDNVVELSSLQQGRLKLAKEPFSFAQLLTDIKLSLHTKASLSSNSLEINIAPNLPEHLIGDKSRMEQVIINLIDNALLFNNGKHIIFNISENNRRANKSSLRFEVLHEGAIPEDLVHFSLLQDSTQIDAEGLSFSIVRDLVDLLEGTITVNNSEDGSTQQVVNLKVSFPLHKIEIPEEETITAAKFKFETKVRVLVAEENSTTQLTALKVLVSTGNFDTAVFTDPKELLEAVEKYEYDLILMSSSISRIDALELIGIIKQYANNANRNIPIIALTTYTAKEDISAYRKAGFKDVVKKPYTDDELLNTIYKRLSIKKFL